MKLDLLANATVVDDAIRFVSQKSKEKENLKSSAAIYNDTKHEEESGEPDHYENGDQLEEEQEGEADETATNQVF